MSFLRPALLWLLLLVPLDLVLALRSYPGFRASTLALTPPSRRQARDRALSRAFAVGRVASFVCAASLVLALAGPRWGSAARLVERRGLSLAVVLDVSRSMLSVEGGKTRLDRAKTALRGLVRGLGDPSVSLVVAKGDAVLLLPLTEDIEALEGALDWASPENLSAAGSRLDLGIERGLESLEAAGERGRVILLVSDGGHRGPSAAAAARRAAEAGATLLCLGIGGESPAPVPAPQGGNLLDERGLPRLSSLDRGALEALARAGKGRFHDEEGLAELRAELASREGAGRSYERRRAERSGLLALLAFAALLVRLAADRLQALSEGPLPRRARRGLGLLLVLVCLSSCSGARSYGAILDGNALARRGEHQEAVAAYLRVKEGDFGQILAYDLANVYARLGELPAALELYDEAKSRGSGKLPSWARYNEGLALYEKGRYEEAWRAFKAVLALDPSDEDARRNLELAWAAWKKRGSAPPEDLQRNSRKEGGLGEEELRVLERFDSGFWLPGAAAPPESSLEDY